DCRSAIAHPAARAASGILVERLFHLVGLSRAHAGAEGAAARGAGRCRALFTQTCFGGGSKGDEQDGAKNNCPHVCGPSDEKTCKTAVLAGLPERTKSQCPDLILRRTAYFPGPLFPATNTSRCGNFCTSSAVWLK